MSMKGYKAFNEDWTCKGFQYEIGKTYELPEGSELKICECGFHFCENPIDVFGYYPYHPYHHSGTKIAEVEALEEIQQEGTKFCTNKIRIIREVPRDELDKLISQSSPNVGNYNTGNYNTGDFNSGDGNVGDSNSGNYNTGHLNSGDSNAGNCNSGDDNTGNSNTGNRNTGFHNNGYANTGNYNTGDHNTGNYNTGDFNTGYFNTGNYNTGDFNSGDFNAGMFNTDTPKMRLFNQYIDMTIWEFYRSIDYDFDSLVIDIRNKHLSDKDIKHIKELPNFDPVIFKKITGIDLTE